MSVHDLSTYRGKRNHAFEDTAYLEALWGRYDDTRNWVDTMPPWMILKVMSYCRGKLRDREGERAG